MQTDTPNKWYDWEEAKTERESEIEEKIRQVLNCGQNNKKKQRISHDIGKLQENYKLITGNYYSPNIHSKNQLYQNLKEE